MIVHPYPPVPSVGSNRWGAMVKYLRRSGHEVSVVTTNAFGGLDGERDTFRTTDLMALPWLRRLVGLGPLGNPGVPAQAAPPVPGMLTKTVVPDAFLLSWMPMAYRSAMRAARERRFDCVITSAPSESTHFIGLALHRRGMPWVADFRDGWIFEPYRPPMPTAPQRALDRALERAVVRRADVVIAATRPIAADFEQRLGVGALHVPNGWDPELEPGLPDGHPREEGEVTLVHTGKLTGLRGRDPSTLFAALRQVVSQNPALGKRIRLVLAGPQDTDDARAIAEAGLGELVQYVGNLPRTEALALQRRADALVLLTSRDVCEATGKLFEYLTAGPPIIALAAGNEAARIVNETDTGITVDPDDVVETAAAIVAASTGALRASHRARELDRYIYPAPADATAAAVELAIAKRSGA